MTEVALIEIPKGGKVKYEHDKETGRLMVDRVLPYSMVYPQNYGYIPNTLAEDGDPVDIFVVMAETLLPGCLVHVIPIGLITMVDKGEVDHKVIAVCKSDPLYQHVNSLDDLPKHQVEEIVHFLQNYKPPGVVQVQEVLPAVNAYLYIRGRRTGSTAL